MKICTAIVLLCLAMAPLACGGSESATSAPKVDTSSGEQEKPEAAPAKAPVAAEVGVPKIGSYPHEGPFAAISGGKGNEKPHFDPANRPPPKNPLVRDLEKGSGPAAQLGDEVTIYYAGALYETGKVQYYGWPPSPPTSFELGGGIIPKLWNVGIEGLRAGGVREVVAPSRFFGGTGAVDYVIALMRVNPS
jgi:peptidylprolyl isomerase